MADAGFKRIYTFISTSERIALPKLSTAGEMLASLGINIGVAEIGLFYPQNSHHASKPMDNQKLIDEMVECADLFC